MKFDKILLICLLWVVMAGASSCSAYDNERPSDTAQDGKSVEIRLWGYVFDEAGTPLKGIEVGIVDQSVVKTTSDGYFWIEKQYIPIYSDNENLYLQLNIHDPAGVFESTQIIIDKLFVVENLVVKEDIEVTLKKK